MCTKYCAQHWEYSRNGDVTISALMRLAVRQGRWPFAENVLITTMGCCHRELRKHKAGEPNLCCCGPPALDALGDLDLPDTKRNPVQNADSLHSISPVHVQTHEAPSGLKTRLLVLNNRILPLAHLRTPGVI